MIIDVHSTRLVPPLGGITRVTKNPGESPDEFFIVAGRRHGCSSIFQPTQIHKHHENMGRAPHHASCYAMNNQNNPTSGLLQKYSTVTFSACAWTTQWAENTHLDGGPRWDRTHFIRRDFQTQLMENMGPWWRSSLPVGIIITLW